MILRSMTEASAEQGLHTEPGYMAWFNILQIM